VIDVSWVVELVVGVTVGSTVGTLIGYKIFEKKFYRRRQKWVSWALDTLQQELARRWPEIRRALAREGAELVREILREATGEVLSGGRPAPEEG
jgi:uncharacterized membrane-anchored protein YhcB (DUF1043 family)